MFIVIKMKKLLAVDTSHKEWVEFKSLSTYLLFNYTRFVYVYGSVVSYSALVYMICI